MNIQYLTDTHGQRTAVLIPIDSETTPFSEEYPYASFVSGPA